jgi:hypothetical protein
MTKRCKKAANCLLALAVAMAASLFGVSLSVDAKKSKDTVATSFQEIVRARFADFSQKWLNSAPAKVQEGCVAIPSFTHTPGFSDGPVAFVDYVPEDSEVAKVYAIAKEAVARIEIGDDVCTGVHMGGGLFLTCAHGLGKIEPGRGYVPEATIKVNGIRAEFLAVDPGADVALLSVKELANLPLQRLRSNTHLHHGQLIYTIGYPARSKVPLLFSEQMKSLTVTKRTRSYTGSDAVDGLIVTSKFNGTFSGFSGGPMFYFDRETNMIGITGIHLGEEGEATLRGAPVEYMAMLKGALYATPSRPVIASSVAQAVPGDVGFVVLLRHLKSIDLQTGKQIPCLPSLRGCPIPDNE